MLDLRILQENPELVAETMNKRGLSGNSIVKTFLEMDSSRRALITKIDIFKKERNDISAKGKKPTAEEIEKVKEIKTKTAELETALKELTARWQETYDLIPNIARPDTPNGKGEADNVDVYAWTPTDGEIPASKINKPGSATKFMPEFPSHANKNFKGAHHIDIGKALDIIDNEQSAIVSGSRFTYIKNEGALLQYALFELLKDKLITEGFIPVVPPLLVRERALYGTSHFPADKEQVYKIDGSNVEDNNQLYLVGSSEPSNFALYMDKTLDIKDLPIKLMAYTTCFRSEAGSWGKDTRGIKRVHQFDKLEMDLICHPDESNELAENYLLGINKWLLQTLEIPFRIVRKCFGDMGYYASHAQWDPEAWLPSQQEFMEVGTSTNTTDYQARRLNIKFTDVDGQKKFAHTVNDTGVAMGRMIIAIIDNYQQPDGSVKIPKSLQKYIGKEIISK
ncbi:serine--tRNA ligase [Candidatus Dojkabacteria bacterium]|nr:serine--tRNA ligase [Candidatus Dojkabacteria bacterium]